MTPVWMRIKHDPPYFYGDCARACMASILDLPASEVPHFCSDDSSPAAYKAARHHFYAVHGIGELVINYDGSLESLMAHMADTSPNVYWILLGKSPRGHNHEVVCLGGRIVHDPSVSGGGIVGPADPTGRYYATFILDSRTVKYV